MAEKIKAYQVNDRRVVIRDELGQKLSEIWVDKEGDVIVSNDPSGKVYTEYGETT